MVKIWIEFIDIILMHFISQMRGDIQNITVSEHDNHRDSFQVKFPNVFRNYVNGEMRVRDQKFIDWDHYRFTLWQTQLNSLSFVLVLLWYICRRDEC